MLNDLGPVAWPLCASVPLGVMPTQSSSPEGPGTRWACDPSAVSLPEVGHSFQGTKDRVYKSGPFGFVCQKTELKLREAREEVLTKTDKSQASGMAGSRGAVCLPAGLASLGPRLWQSLPSPPRSLLSQRLSFMSWVWLALDSLGSHAIPKPEDLNMLCPPLGHRPVPEAAVVWPAPPHVMGEQWEKE